MVEAQTKNRDGSIEAQVASGDEDAAAVNNVSPEHIRGTTAADDAESQPLQQDVIDTTATKDTSPSPLPADGNSSPNSTDNNNQGETNDQLSSIKNTPQKYRNINSYYGHKIGFYQTLSLLLNAGLMLYAHLGLSAVIYSSRDPSITALDSVALDDEGGTDTNNMTNSTAAMCNEQDIDLWTASGGESNRPTQSNYCSRTYTDSSN
eukprot:scaffold144_cov94-Skeletonema_dohrnii-CCMP3373.AAC.1